MTKSASIPQWFLSLLMKFWLPKFAAQITLWARLYIVREELHPLLVAEKQSLFDQLVKDHARETELQSQIDSLEEADSAKVKELLVELRKQILNKQLRLVRNLRIYLANEDIRYEMMTVLIEARGLIDMAMNKSANAEQRAVFIQLLKTIPPAATLQAESEVLKNPARRLETLEFLGGLPTEDIFQAVIQEISWAFDRRRRK